MLHPGPLLLPPGATFPVDTIIEMQSGNLFFERCLELAFFLNASYLPFFPNAIRIFESRNDDYALGPTLP